MFKSRKTIPLLMGILMLFSTLNVFAETDKLADMVDKYDSPGYLSKEVLERENYIIIDSEEKARQVAEEDLKTLEKERAEKLKNIPSFIVEQYKEFEKANELEMENKILSRRDKNKINETNIQEMLKDLKLNKLIDANYSNSELLKDFKAFSNNEIRYKTIDASDDLASIDDSTLKEYLTILRTNTAEDAILLAFALAEYPVSHDMFLHSLVRNPKNLYVQTEGSKAYNPGYGTMNLAPAVKLGFFEEREFIKKLYNFARASNTPLNQDGLHHEFNVGDLAYSIHGTTNLRFNRIRYDRAFFRIWDIYDFDGLLNKLLDLFTNTNIYGITIEGLHDGAIR